MTDEEFKALQPGDMVRGAASGICYIVTGSYGGRVTAVRTVDLTNPVEWVVVKGPGR